MSIPLSRRHCLRLGWGAGLAATALSPRVSGAAPANAQAGTPKDIADAQSALPARALVFERDHGSHPDFQTEWWYVTGFLNTAPGLGGSPAFGFQVTFFRSRVASTQTLNSALAARQLLFAHAAVTDVRQGRLVHDQRIAREGMGLAYAREDRMDVAIGTWRLASDTARRHVAQVDSDTLALDLALEDGQPLLLQGRQGLSRKGPQPEQASYYYSRPQLRVQGTLRLGGRGNPAQTVEGQAWLDHEWSHALLSREAEGWDWAGMNLDDGSALTTFQLRRPDGSALWAGGSWRPGPTSADKAAGKAGGARSFGPRDVVWRPQRLWTSPRTGTTYPVEWQVQTPVGLFQVRALVDDQELDASASTGGVYWEGLSQLSRADGGGTRAGLGYLEMTGYREALRVR